MYLKASLYVSGWDHKTNKSPFKALLKAAGLTAKEVCQDFPSGEVSLNVAYWRKANQIHKWFVDNVQDGKDDCGSYPVSREQLTQLRDLAAAALLKPSKAGEILPPQTGFFFGNTDANSEWYKDDLKSTVKQLDKVLNSPRMKDFDFEYQSSW